MLAGGNAEQARDVAVFGDRPQCASDRGALHEKSKQRDQYNGDAEHRELDGADAHRSDVEALGKDLLGQLQRIGTPDVGRDILQDDREAERRQHRRDHGRGTERLVADAFDDGRDQCGARHARDQGQGQRQLREHHREPEITAEHEELGDRKVEDAQDSHDQRVGQGDQGVDRPKRQAVHELLDQHLSVPVKMCRDRGGWLFYSSWPGIAVKDGVASARLCPAIHVLGYRAPVKAWMPGTRPSMTGEYAAALSRLPAMCSFNTPAFRPARCNRALLTARRRSDPARYRRP